MLPADGSVTASANAVATAASTALPPSRSTAAPTSEARWWLLTTMPWRARTGVFPLCAASGGIGSETNRRLRATKKAGRGMVRGGWGVAGAPLYAGVAAGSWQGLLDGRDVA